MGESRRQQRLSTDLPPPRQSSTLPRLNTLLWAFGPLAGETPALPGRGIHEARCRISGSAGILPA